MIVVSRILGLVRQRVLAHFFSVNELSLFFAAFRLPDAIFEVLVFGTFSSAFIPVFAKLIRKNKQDAWDLAARVVNIGVVIFLFAAVGLIIFAQPLYSLIAPGFSLAEQERIVGLTKILFAAQGFFVISYVLTGVLESLKRFLIPALAPIFYNLGIIFGTTVFASKFGLMAPVLGVVIGAFLHFAIQLPLAMKLGFRFKSGIEIDEGVKKIGRLALPRVIEVAFLQVAKTAELFFASLITTAAYTYYTFGNTLQLLPVGLFGTSIAKAALPTLSEKSDSRKDFARTLWKTLGEMCFALFPVATALVVLRIPVIRLVYGTDIFTWEATVQTGMVLSAFSLGIICQSVTALLARGFYALHNTKTPVAISIISIILTIILDFVFVRLIKTPVWGLAAAFSLGSSFQAGTLFYCLNKEINGKLSSAVFIPFLKYTTASLASGGVMFFILKFFDRSVWVKRLSFLTKLEAVKSLPFEKFVLDTRYTFNLLILTLIVGLVGILVYILVSYLLKTKELFTFWNLAKRIFLKKKLGKVTVSKEEPLSPPPLDSEI